jgi:hypothetical protein
MVALRLLAALSALASFVAMGLSAMASDDVSRSRQAHALQTTVLAWFVLSVATPFIAFAIGRWRPGAEGASYLPMVIVGGVAIIWLARF